MPVGNVNFISDAKNNVATVAPIGNVYTNEAFPIIMASYHMSITAGSGGTNLPNVPCGKIEIQNLSGNHVMWYGGVDQHAPSSGRGNELLPMSAGAGFGDKIIFSNNANQISVCASFSGEMISFVAYGNGTNTTIDPSTQGSQPDTVAPSLNLTTPLSGSTGVLINTPTEFQFSKAMDASTIDVSGIFLVKSGQASFQTVGHVPAVITLSGDTVTARLDTSGFLVPLTWYVPFATTNCQATNGLPLTSLVSGGPFQTQARPTVSGDTPLSGSTFQLQSVAPTFQFSEVMDRNTVNISGLYIVVSGQSSPLTTGHLSGSVIYTPGTTTATLNVNSGQYVLSNWYVPMAAPTLANLQDVQVGFNISGSPFQIQGAPLISGWSPLSGTTGCSGGQIVIGTFSQNMNAATINTSGMFLVVSGQTTPLTTGHLSGNISLNANNLGKIACVSGQISGGISGLWFIPFVTVNCKDSFGNPVTATISGAPFKTDAVTPPDTTAPVVSGTGPISGQANIQTNAAFEAVFSEDIQSGLVSTATCVLRDITAASNVALAVSLQSDIQTIVFTPSAILPVNHQIRFEISGNKDLAGNFQTPHSGATFTTELAPLVTATTPVSGATGVATNTNINLTISKQVQSGTVTSVNGAGSVVLQDIQGVFVPIVGNVSLQSDLQTVIFDPISNLTVGDIHRMEISGIKDLDGNFMVPFSGATFTTQVPGFVSSTIPASGATGVTITTPVTVVINIPVASATVNGNTVVIKDAGNNPLASNVSLHSDNVTITVDPLGGGDLGYNAPYTINVSGVTDLGSNFITPSAGNSFTTQNYALTQFFNATSAGSSTDSSTSLYAGNSIRVGEKAQTSQSSLIPRVIKQAQFPLKRVGNPSGGDNTLYCRVRDTNDVIKTTLGSIPVTSLSTSMTALIFTNLSGGFAIAAGTKITVEFSGGNSSNYVGTLRNGNEPAGQSNVTFYYYYNSSEQNQPNTDVGGSCIFWY